MLYLLAYDIKEPRLQKVSKICGKYGIRVQNSVFEMKLDKEEYITLKNELSLAIDEDEDSIRIYRLRKWEDSDLEIINKNNKISLLKSSDIIL